jgi:hypothetical protein
MFRYLLESFFNDRALFVRSEPVEGPFIVRHAHHERIVVYHNYSFKSVKLILARILAPFTKVRNQTNRGTLQRAPTQYHKPNRKALVFVYADAFRLNNLFVAPVSQTTRAWLAIKIELYVPDITPTIKTSMKLSIASPTNR